MNLKDDFLEALNSVKKDIFNGSSDSGEAAVRPDETDSRDIGARSDSITPPPMDDEAVMDAFEQASAIDDTYYNDSDNAADDNDAAAFAPQAPTFKSYEPGASTSGAAVFTGPGTTAVSSYRQDFDRTDLYSDDKTIISKNTVIRGALQTDDSIRLLGQVLGDIDCKSNIVVAGKVRGNTTAANAYIMDAQVDGNMQCEDVVSVSSDAWVLGNIRAQQAEIDGKIKGNLDIRHAVSIGSTSSIIGNISTDELEIKRGAFINGQIMMYTPSRDVLDRFDQFDE